MLNFENTYSELPDDFYEPIKPSAAKEVRLISYNEELADFLGINLSACDDKELALIFSGKKILESSKPLAMAYAGHQFGHFVPQLGDGRAVLLGEIRNSEGKLFDIHLKGAGQTKFSRSGDGRSSLGPVVREYIVSEAMHQLGVPTTRALAAVLSGETVYREESLPGAIFTRVARSHLRVGTFEYFFARKDTDNLKHLVNFAIDRHDPDIEKESERVFLFFQRTARRKLSLVAKWMGLGFIHGVMNTDNTSIGGETIDFGPCAFMDDFSHEKVFSSIDRHGRYAYHKQPDIAFWNLSSLANCLMLILGDDKSIIEGFQSEFENLEAYFHEQWLEVMTRKLGIFNPAPEDQKLVFDFLKYLEEHRLDFTNSFREIPENLESVEDIYQRIKKRLEKQPESREKAIQLMNKNNPYIIPRNHQVERAIQLSLEGDFSHFHKMHKAFKKPFEQTVEFMEFSTPPKPEEVVHQTFCGT